MEPGSAAGRQTAGREAGHGRDTPGSEVIGVEVPGGTLAVELFASGTEPVLAVHGISSQRRRWNWLRDADPGLGLDAVHVCGAPARPVHRPYTAEAVQAFRETLDALVTVRPLAGADHAASIMSVAGARASAGLIAEALMAEALMAEEPS